MPQEGGKKPLFPGKSLPWETANYGFVPVEVEAVCVQCVYSVCTVCVRCVYSVSTVARRCHVCVQQRSHEDKSASISFSSLVCLPMSDQSLVCAHQSKSVWPLLLLSHCSTIFIYVKKNEMKQNEWFSSFFFLNFSSPLVLLFARNAHLKVKFRHFHYLFKYYKWKLKLIKQGGQTSVVLISLPVSNPDFNPPWPKFLDFYYWEHLSFLCHV